MAYCQGIQAGLQVQTIKYQTPKVHIKLHTHTHTCTCMRTLILMLLLMMINERVEQVCHRCREQIPGFSYIHLLINCGNLMTVPLSFLY